MIHVGKFLLCYMFTVYKEESVCSNIMYQVMSGNLSFIFDLLNILEYLFTGRMGFFFHRGCYLRF